jgi:hypothetical protein
MRSGWLTGPFGLHTTGEVSGRADGSLLVLHSPKLPSPTPGSRQRPSSLLLRFLQALLRIAQENARNGSGLKASGGIPTQCQLFARSWQGGDISTYFYHLGVEMSPLPRGYARIAHSSSVCLCAHKV